MNDQNEILFEDLKSIEKVIFKSGNDPVEIQKILEFLKFGLDKDSLIERKANIMKRESEKLATDPDGDLSNSYKEIMTQMTKILEPITTKMVMEQSGKLVGTFGDMLNKFIDDVFKNELFKKLNDKIEKLSRIIEKLSFKTVKSREKKRKSKDYKPSYKFVTTSEEYWDEFFKDLNFEEDA
jgi:hypothetical protein